jgi:hypothetical protein
VEGVRNPTPNHTILLHRSISPGLDSLTQLADLTRIPFATYRRDKVKDRTARKIADMKTALEIIVSITHKAAHGSRSFLKGHHPVSGALGEYRLILLSR